MRKSLLLSLCFAFTLLTHLFSACLLGNAHPCKVDSDCKDDLICYQAWCVPRRFRENERTNQDAGSETIGGLDRRAESFADLPALDTQSDSTAKNDEQEITTPERPGEQQEQIQETPAPSESPTESSPGDSTCTPTCTLGAQQPCYPVGQTGCQQDGSNCVGTCSAGTRFCHKAPQTLCPTWSSCYGMRQPETQESCDGKDNDCNGQVDEQLKRSCYEGPAGTQGQGPCLAGTQTCTQGTWGTCQNQTLPGAEICNKKDDDCDGKSDNVFLETILPQRDIGQKMLVDANKNTYLLSRFSNTLRIGTQTLKAKGFSDLLVIKLSPQGSVLWIVHIENPGLGEFGGFVLNQKTSEVFVTGTIGTPGSSTTTFSPTNTGPKQYRTDGRKFFLLRINNNGQIVTPIILDESVVPQSASEGLAIAIDTQNNIYTAGTIQNELSIPNFKKLTSSQGTNPATDAFLFKWSSDLSKLEWSKTLSTYTNNTHSPSTINQIALSSSTPPKLYVAGNFIGALQTAGGTKNNTGAGPRPFVGEIDSSNTQLLQWALIGTEPSTTTQWGSSLDILTILEKNKKLYLSGVLGGKIIFGGQQIIDLQGHSGFVMQIDPTTQKIGWTTLPTSTQPDTNISDVSGLLSLPTSSLVQYGVLSGTLKFGATQVTSPVDTPYVAYLDAQTGKYTKVFQATNSSQKPFQPTSLALGPQQKLFYLLGFAEGNFQLGSRAFSITQPSTFLTTFDVRGGWECYP